MMIISYGTIINDSSNEKISSLPGNLNLEKAKAARIVVNEQVTMQPKSASAELMKYLPNGAVLKA